MAVAGLGLGLAAAAAGCTSEAVPAEPLPTPTPSASPLPRISTVAGTDRFGYEGEGQLATDTPLSAPVDVSFDTAGEPLIIDWNNHRVRALLRDGSLATVLGTGAEEYGQANTAATAFGVHHPLALEVTPDGEWLVAGYHDPRVLLVDRGRRVRVVAGFGGAGNTGDGGAATLATFDAPAGVARARDGSTFIVDELHHRVRRVRTDGVIEAFAGDGARGHSGDGGPAREARLDGPLRLVVDRARDEVFICDTGNHAIRKVDAQGTITTVAGAGTPGFSGDGGPATAAELYRPIDLVLLDDGGFLVADSENHRIRRVFGDGRIETLVGTATAGFSGDGGPARDASLQTPWGIAVDDEARLWIADTYNHRVRRVEAGLLAGARRR